jgi:hypothetical protein
MNFLCCETFASAAIQLGQGDTQNQGSENFGFCWHKIHSLKLNSKHFLFLVIF